MCCPDTMMTYLTLPVRDAVVRQEKSGLHQSSMARPKRLAGGQFGFDDLMLGRDMTPIMSFDVTLNMVEVVYEGLGKPGHSDLPDYIWDMELEVLRS